MMNAQTFKNWICAASVRALKTAAQTAVSVIGASAVMGQVDWILCGSGALLAAIVSVLTSIAGIPEVGEGASLLKIAKGETEDEDEDDKIGGSDD